MKLEIRRYLLSVMKESTGPVVLVPRGLLLAILDDSYDDRQATLALDRAIEAIFVPLEPEDTTDDTIDDTGARDFSKSMNRNNDAEVDSIGSAPPLVRLGPGGDYTRDFPPSLAPSSPKGGGGVSPGKGGAE